MIMVNVRDMVVISIGAVIAIGGYLTTGDLGRSDNPIAKRHQILMSKEVMDLSPNEITVRLQRLIKDRPNDPEPHYFLGQHLVLLGQEDKATQAYLAALRRNPQHVSALIALGDLETRKSGGRVTESAARAYQQAYDIDDEQLGAGFKVGLSLWQDKKFREATAYWDKLRKQLEPETPESVNLEAWINQVSANAPDQDGNEIASPVDGNRP